MIEMIVGWDDAPIAEIDLTIKPKHVTFIIPFYQNPLFLIRQLKLWSLYSSRIREHISAVIVDDGSPKGKAQDILKYVIKPFPIRLFYIDVDIRFNWIAARNIAMKFAKDGWCLGTDMDHIIPESTAEMVVFGNHNQDYIYRFNRQDHTGENIHPHPNSWFMTRKKFWEFGGYDENFSGFYGSDGDARRRWVKVAIVRTMREKLIRYEYIDDSSTMNYQRKQKEDFEIQHIIKNRTKDWKPKVLSFPFHEVQL